MHEVWMQTRRGRILLRVPTSILEQCENISEEERRAISESVAEVSSHLVEKVADSLDPGRKSKRALERSEAISEAQRLTDEHGGLARFDNFAANTDARVYQAAIRLAEWCGPEVFQQGAFRPLFRAAFEYSMNMGTADLFHALAKAEGFDLKPVIRALETEPDKTSLNDWRGFLLSNWTGRRFGVPFCAFSSNALVDFLNYTGWGSKNPASTIEKLRFALKNGQIPQSASQSIVTVVHPKNSDPKGVWRVLELGSQSR